MKQSKTSDKIIPKLLELYRSFGCEKFKMKRFEEYDFYLENKSFLKSENIIAFSDGFGRLLALKPDVTLSIVKSTGTEAVGVRKVYYNEFVYRAAGDTHEIKEIPQVGLEYIGELDRYSECEAILLAAKSLSTISRDCTLDISHLGFVGGLLDEVSADSSVKEQLLRCIGSKNRHGIADICKEAGIDTKLGEIISEVAVLRGPLDRTLEKAEGLAVNDAMKKSLEELEAICKPVTDNSSVSINLDFSIVNDMSYYNGVIFQGFVNGISTSVLSGGRYDLLMSKLGKKAGAIGFAVYLDQIELAARPEREYDCDMLVLYDDQSDTAAVMKTVSEYAAEGLTVAAKKCADSTRARECCRVIGKEVTIVEGND